MICLPEDTIGFNGSSIWVAYGFINSWLSVYRGDGCSIPSVQMHEIGHNLDLSHSAEGAEGYGDQSGMVSVDRSANFDITKIVYKKSFLSDTMFKLKPRWDTHTLKAKVLSCVLMQLRTGNLVGTVSVMSL